MYYLTTIRYNAKQKVVILSLTKKKIKKSSSSAISDKLKN